MRASSFLFLVLILTPAVFVLAGCPAASDCEWTVTNDTGFEIETMELSDSETDDWGADLLGADTVPDGETSSFTVEAGTWDLRATDVDGDTYTLLAVETCVGGEALATTITVADID